jgi:hypothetical protein
MRGFPRLGRGGDHHGKREIHQPVWKRVDLETSESRDRIDFHLRLIGGPCYLVTSEPG